MTREDAIAYGKRVIDLGLNDETQAFCEIAIEALKLIPDNATNGDVIKALFPNCKDWKAKIEDNDGEVYEVHFAELPNNMTINKYEESWWNAPYEAESEEHT